MVVWGFPLRFSLVHVIDELVELISMLILLLFLVYDSSLVGQSMQELEFELGRVLRLVALNHPADHLSLSVGRDFSPELDLSLECRSVYKHE